MSLGGTALTKELTAVGFIHDEDHGGSVWIGGSILSSFKARSSWFASARFTVQLLHRDHLHTMHDHLNTRGHQKKRVFSLVSTYETQRFCFLHASFSSAGHLPIHTLSAHACAAKVESSSITSNVIQIQEQGERCRLLLACCCCCHQSLNHEKILGPAIFTPISMLVFLASSNHSQLQGRTLFLYKILYFRPPPHVFLHLSSSMFPLSSSNIYQSLHGSNSYSLSPPSSTPRVLFHPFPSNFLPSNWTLVNSFSVLDDGTSTCVTLPNHRRNDVSSHLNPLQSSPILNHLLLHLRHLLLLLLPVSLPPLKPGSALGIFCSLHSWISLSLSTTEGDCFVWSCFEVFHNFHFRDLSPETSDLQSMT